MCEIIIFVIFQLENRMLQHQQKLLSAHYKLKCITVRCQAGWIILHDQVWIFSGGYKLDQSKSRNSTNAFLQNDSTSTPGFENYFRKLAWTQFAWYRFEKGVDRQRELLKPLHNGLNRFRSKLTIKMEYIMYLVI